MILKLFLFKVLCDVNSINITYSGNYTNQRCNAIRSSAIDNVNIYRLTSCSNTTSNTLLNTMPILIDICV